MAGDGEVFGCVGGHEDDAARGVEVAVGFAGDEELAACVEGEDAVEFFLWGWKGGVLVFFFLVFFPFCKWSRFSSILTPSRSS